MKNKKDAGEFKAPLSVMWRCVWRARVLATFTEPGMGPLLAWISVQNVWLLGWMAYEADTAAGALWLAELIVYGLEKTARDPGAALAALRSGAPWAWVGVACLAARARWLWLGLSRDASQEQAGLKASSPLLYWLAIPWLAAGAANRRLALRSLGWARSFAASSRTLPAQFAAGFGCSIVAGLAIMDILALVFNAALSYLVGVILMVSVARGNFDFFRVEYVAFMAASGAVWIKQGALQAAWGSIRALWRGAKARAGVLKARRIGTGESAWAAMGRAKASLTRGLLESAASDGTLSQAEREALRSSTKRKLSQEDSKPSSLRL